jgi:hypothetical protein
MCLHELYQGMCISIEGLHTFFCFGSSLSEFSSLSIKGVLGPAQEGPWIEHISFMTENRQSITYRRFLHWLIHLNNDVLCRDILWWSPQLFDHEFEGHLGTEGQPSRVVGLSHHHSKLCVARNGGSVSKISARISSRVTQSAPVSDVTGPYESGVTFTTFFLLQPLNLHTGCIDQTRISNSVDSGSAGGLGCEVGVFGMQGHDVRARHCVVGIAGEGESSELSGTLSTAGGGAAHTAHRVCAGVACG